MQDETPVADMRVLIQRVDAVGVEQRSATLDAVDDVAFAEQKLSQISTVLAGDASDEGNFLVQGVDCLEQGGRERFGSSHRRESAA